MQLLLPPLRILDFYSHFGVHYFILVNFLFQRFYDLLVGAVQFLHLDLEFSLYILDQ